MVYTVIRCHEETVKNLLPLVTTPVSSSQSTGEKKKALVLSCGRGYRSLGSSLYGHTQYPSRRSGKTFLKSESTILVWLADSWESWWRRDGWNESLLGITVYESTGRNIPKKHENLVITNLILTNSKLILGVFKFRVCVEIHGVLKEGRVLCRQQDDCDVMIILKRLLAIGRFYFENLMSCDIY